MKKKNEQQFFVDRDQIHILDQIICIKYMSLSWYFLIIWTQETNKNGRGACPSTGWRSTRKVKKNYMNSDCFRFQGSFFSFWAVLICRGKFYVGGRLWPSGVVGLWGRGPGDEGTSWSQNCEDWIDPTWFCLNPKASRVSLEDSWSDAAKVRLQNSNSCRGWDLEMWQWRFWWRFCGVSTGTISAVKFGGVKELVFVDDIHISLLSGAGSRILLIAVKY